jgi:hypothetical protein
MTLALQHVGLSHVADPTFCSEDLSLSTWSQLCSDCAVDNVALGKPTSQSRTALGGDPWLAVDGNTDGIFSDNSVTHTNFENAWWQVDLGFLAEVVKVNIWNRSDCCSERLSNFWVRFSNDGIHWDTYNAGGPAVVTGQAGFPTVLTLNKIFGRYVRIELQGSNYLSLAEIQVFADPFAL